MKRQAGREASPSRSIAKRLRDREVPPPPLALLLADTRSYHRRSREKARPREELHQRHELLRSTDPPAPRLEYKTLLISNLGAQVSDEDVEDALFHEFKKFGDVSVKLSHTPEMGRIAYVNFRHPEDAKEARHAKGASRLVLGERQLKIEPMYVRRRSVTPPDVGYLPLHAPYPYRQRSLSPPSSIRELRARQFALERERLLDYYGMLDERGRPYGLPAPVPAAEDLKPEDDQRATSNLFIGNLDGGVTEAELRRGFDKYGVIEDVVIKRPARGQGGAYAFVKFQNLDMAHRAKVAMQGRPIGGNPIKIGYGKANPTTRLWVGGLGPGNSLAALAREFDRFGSIRNIDYVKGDSFAYIQYESLDAAQAACTQMRGFPLGGAERRLRVDFAKVEESPASRLFPPVYQPPVLLPSHYELLGESYGRHRSLERSPPHSLLALRDRALLDSASPPRREGRGGRGSRERWLKEREERRSRRRSKTASPERGRGRGVTPQPSPDRAQVRAPDSTTEPRDHTPEPAGRHPVANDDEAARHHGKRAPGDQNANAQQQRGAVVDTPPADAPALSSLSEFALSALSRTWRGCFALKNSSFPTDLFLLQGGDAFFSAVMKDSQLKIAQRLRMDQTRLDEVERRIRLGRPDAFAILLALQGPVDRQGQAPEPGLQIRLLRHLVTYLRNKEAAGVVSLPAAKEGGPAAMLYAFPPGEFSTQYLQNAKRIVGNLEEEHMVIVIVNDTN